MGYQRVIQRYPERNPAQWYEGSVPDDPAAIAQQSHPWCGGNVEQVIKAMDADLGPAPEAEYQIVEGGGPPVASA